MRFRTPVLIVSICLLIVSLCGPVSAHLHPALGRFAQRDPMGYVDGVHFYAIYRNNSLAYLDPSGYGTWCNCPTAPAPPVPAVWPACGPGNVGQEITINGARVWGLGSCAPLPGTPLAITCACAAKTNCRKFDDYQCALSLITGAYQWAPLSTNPRDSCL